MPVFNWIETRFAGGEDYVSDAPEDVAGEIASVISPGAPGGDALEFGWKPLPSSSLSVVYLRCGAPGLEHGARFVHAVASEEIEAPAPQAIEALFRAHYGADTEARIEELSRHLGGLPVHGAAAAITDLFMDRKELSMLRRAPAPEPQLGSPIRAGHLQVPWLIASVAIAAAGFLAGSRFEAERELPAVAAPPPELVERLAALEKSQSVANELGDELLEQERQRHAEALAGKDREIAALGERLAALEQQSAQEQPAAPAALRLAQVRVDTLRIRSGPGPKHGVVADLKQGDRVVTAAQEQDGWVRVEVPSPGWVASEFLAFIEPAAQAPAP